MAATTPYALPEGLFYLDTRSAAEYAEHSGGEIVMKQLVKLSPGEALDAWIKHVWLAGTEKEITAGEGRGYVNHKRVVAKLGAEEQITAAGLPSASDASGAVPSIQYKVTATGPLPIDGHIGFVRFVPVDAEQSEIVWTIKLNLAAEGNAVFADPKALPPFLVTAISGLLAAVAKNVETA